MISKFYASAALLLRVDTTVPIQEGIWWNSCPFWTFWGREKLLSTTQNRTRIPHLSIPHTRHYIGYAMKAYIKNLITVIKCICSEYTTIFTKISCILQDVYSTNNKKSLSLKSVHIFPRGQSVASQLFKAMYVQQYALRHVRK
jgi:hypothetical protein